MGMNVLAVVGGIVVLFVGTLIVLLAFKSFPHKNHYFISAQEDREFLRDSIAIQPNNSTIFGEISLDEVVLGGNEIMVKDNYRMLQGVNTDGI